MKNKFFAVMIISVVLCLSGCGNVEEPKESEPISTEAPTNTDVVPTQIPEDVEVTPTPVEPTDLPEVTEPEVTPEVTQEPMMTQIPFEYLKISQEHHYDSCVEDGVSMMYGHYDTIQLHTEKYPALTVAVENFNEEHVANAQSYLDKIEQWAVEEYKEYGAESYMGPYMWEGEIFVRRADSRALSLVEECYDYSGGAHGYSYFNSMSWDAQTGEELALEDVVKDVSCLPEILDKELTEKYPDVGFFCEPLADALDDYVESDNPLYQELLKFVWTLDYEGVTFYFGSYEIASYVDGVQQVTVSYSEYPELFEEKFFAEIPADYVLKLNDCRICSDVDLNQDGVTDYISVSRSYNIDSYMSDSIAVTVNGNTFTIEKYCYESETYFVRVHDKNYLYVQSVADSDWRSVDVFEITPNSVEYMGLVNGGLQNFTNSSDFAMAVRMDMLSTYDAVGDCFVGVDGIPTPKSGVYTIEREIILTSTVDIPAELVDESGSLSGETFIFPAGTAFELKTTDGVTYVDVLAEDGQRCRFYTISEWPATVNGLDAESSFEMLYYAG